MDMIRKQLRGMLNLSNFNSFFSWNYHQGPEWLWVACEYLSARLRVAYALRDKDPQAWQSALAEVKDRTHRFIQHIVKESAWSSLPELTNRDGRFCPGSCPSQAWSVGCFIETLEILNQQLAKK
jgi:glycogen debranching enzyme